MATTITAPQSAIANLYAALFNRAPDAAGFGFWGQALANGASLPVITTAFLASPESKAIYSSSQTAEQFITSFYTTVFGRAPDASGQAFWVGVLNFYGGSSSDSAKAIAVTQLISVVSTPLLTKPADITDAQYAQTVADRSTFTNKVIAGVYYAVDAKGTSLGVAKQVLAVVNASAASVDTAKAIADGVNNVGTDTGTGTNVGTTFTGTVGTDLFTGTGANDTFNFLVDGTTPSNSTLTSVDKLVGGAGIDTLNINTVGGVADVLNAADVSAIETIAIRATTADKVSILKAAPTAVTTISVSGTGYVNVGVVTGLAAGTKFALTGVTGSGSYAASYAAAVTTADVSLSGGNVTSGSVRVNGTGLTSVTITGSNGVNSMSGANLANGIKTVTIDAQSALTIGSINGVGAATTITVTGAGVANIGSLNANVSTVTATANTGGLTATLGAVTQKVTGSAGINTISTGIALTTGSVDAGAGTADTLIVTNSAALNTGALGLKYTNFEILQVNSGVAVDMDNIAGITAVRVADAAGATTVTNLTVGLAAAVTITSADANGVITLGVKGASTGGQVDTVKATLFNTVANAAVAVNLTGITLVGVEKLELTGNGTATATSGTITLTTNNATSLDSIIVKSAGIAVVTIAAGHSATSLVVDGSGMTGRFGVDASLYNTSTGITIRAGSGDNVLFGSKNGDTIVSGAGNDLITGDGGVGNGTTFTTLNTHVGADTITGGLGNDIFGFGLGTTVSTVSTITDLNLGSAVVGGKVDSLVFSMTSVLTPTIVTLTTGQQTTVTNAATLADAVDAALAVAATGGNVAQFTYGAHTYLLVNGATANATFNVGQDHLIKITGVTGTLDASDVSFIGGLV